MTSPITDRPRPRPRAYRTPSGGFARLGRGLVRHPWYPVLFWIVLAAIALPFLMRLSGAEANSATTLPASAPSAVASAELARLFPSASAGGSTSVVLLQGTDLTGPSGQNATIGVAQRIASDRNLTDLAAVSTLYSDYAEYLGGVAELSIGVVGESEAGSSAFAVVNASAALAWGPPDRFLSQWESLVAAHPSTPPRDENAPAYASTASALSGDAPALEVLRAFYGQPGGSGWNGTQDCAGTPASASDCAISVVRSGAVLAALGPADPALPDAGTASLENLDLSNYSQPRAVEIATEAALVNGTSIPLSFVETVRAAFPAGAPSALELAAWSASVADATPVARYPVPIPAGLLGEYVDPGGNATVVIVTFSVPSGYTNPSGSDPVFADVREIDRLLPGALEAADPTGGISAWQTGDAALNAQESSDLSADLA
ncbi:MAG TPA: hypothetical protein VGS23_09690, partial [Thermoplasmata archaeon]|nr:hypothetical protein [Thermoplasmata archaeon]